MKLCLHCSTPFQPVAHQAFCGIPCRTKFAWHKRRMAVDYHEQRAFAQMRDRCYRPSHPSYYRYGGRGITVCDRWSLFVNFFEDMGFRPSPDHSLDRIDNDGNYEPSNCRWATEAEQNCNRSNSFPKEHEAAMLDGIARGLSWRQIGKEIGRCDQSVRARAHRLGLKSGYQANKPIFGRSQSHAQPASPEPSQEADRG